MLQPATKPTMDANESKKSPPLDTARRIHDSLPEGGLFAGMEWRVAPAPFPLPDPLARDLDKLGHRLWKFLQACDLLYRRSCRGTMPPWIANLLDAGKPPELIAIARSRGLLGQLPAVIRPDILPTEDGYVVSEIDSVPGGIGLLAWLQQQYETEGHPTIGGHTGMLKGFQNIFPDRRADLLVSEEASAYRPEMEWLAQQLNARQADSFRVRDAERPAPAGNSLYRFFELFDLPNLPATAPILQQAAEGRVFLTAPPKHYLEEKLLFALFWLRPLESFWIRTLGSAIFRQLRKSLPRTWLMDPTPLPPHAAYPGLDIQSWDELKSFSQKERHFVLKISGFSEKAWGARGVHVGHDLPCEDWARAVDAALGSFDRNPSILQRFHSAAVIDCLALSPDGNSIETFPGRARICPYYFFDPTKNQSPRLGGALATLCPADKKILHGMRDSVLCPAAHSPENPLVEIA